ncbi:MAG: hypothetical protein GF408_07595 [Candidatus Omnitrophica bacterium]|nr:hypothetical protein [Candidatus Omnitrophota bacterium]
MIDLFNAGTCRAEELILWYGVAEHGLLALIFAMELVPIGVAFLFSRGWLSKRLGLGGNLKLRAPETEIFCDNWPKLGQEARKAEKYSSLTFADFERCVSKIKLKKKELCGQK